MQQDLTQYKLIIFNLYDALVKAFGVEPLPGRVERLAELRKQDKIIVIGTNQAGPTWRWYTGKEKFPTVATLAGNIKQICGALGLQEEHWYIAIGDQRIPDAILEDSNYLSFANSENGYLTALDVLKAEFADYLNPDLVHVSGDHAWRKPSPGMLIAAAERLHVPIEQCLFVGDRPEDEQAARAAKMAFMWSAEFFDELPAIEDHPF